jgi:hypothetical protein
MELWIGSFAVIGLAFAAMALGALLGRAPLRRGCGDVACEACARPCPRRRARDGGGARA